MINNNNNNKYDALTCKFRVDKFLFRRNRLRRLIIAALYVGINYHRSDNDPAMSGSLN